MTNNHEVFNPDNVAIEPVFNNYKEKQNYYREKYKNRGTTVWVSKRIDRNGKVVQPGKTYENDEGRVVYKTAK